MEKLNSKLENWHELDFAEFLKELEKQKVKIRLKQKAEWAEYFETERQKAQTILQKIQKNDQEIDRMVFDLYGLTAEEQQIIVT